LGNDSDRAFNCIDLYLYNFPEAAKLDSWNLIKNCYRYYVTEHPELLESPSAYSEASENKLVHDYILKITNEQFYSACRVEALEGQIYYHSKRYKFSKLLDELGMNCFIDSGVGLITERVASLKQFDVLRLGRQHEGRILLASFFAPNRVASLESALLGDLSKSEIIYLNKEVGWYGQLGGSIVGSVRDLLTVKGCSWNYKTAYWADERVASLHSSLKPSQCIEIWTSAEKIVTDRNPLSLISKASLEEDIKDSLTKLNITQIKQLEEATGRQLKKTWLGLKTSETEVSGMRFVKRDARYYYYRGKQLLEYTNFAVDLTRIRKEDGEFYQYGYIAMNDDYVEFRAKRKLFVSQYSFIKLLTDILLEAGVGIPSIAPNLKHYITNVIDAFNPVNIIEKPTPSVADTSKPNLVSLDL
jgi:hypothetical protein